MKSIEEIQAQLSRGDIALSRHALIRMIERNISQAEIQEAGKNAMIIEDYPHDKYAPSCLLLGFCESGRPLHMQVSRQISVFTKIITLYQPDETEWLDYSKRR